MPHGQNSSDNNPNDKKRETERCKCAFTSSHSDGKKKIVKVYVGTNNLEIDDGKWIERKKNSRPIDSKGQQMGEHQSSPILGAR